MLVLSIPSDRNGILFTNVKLLRQEAAFSKISAQVVHPIRFPSWYLLSSEVRAKPVPLGKEYYEIAHIFFTRACGARRKVQPAPRYGPCQKTSASCACEVNLDLELVGAPQIGVYSS